MKAAVYTGYGPPDVIQIQDVETPVPKDDEVLIKVRAASVNPLDYHLMRGVPRFSRLFFGLRRPKVKIPGRDVAGEVEAVGDKVTQFKTRDEVFGACIGAFAEYACAPESKLVFKPPKVTFEQAASSPIAGLTALQASRDKGQVKSGHNVLINGAAGGVGTFAVQVGKWLGADVTGVCSTRNLEMVRALGADDVIDYTREDFTKSDKRYDLLFDLIANHPPAACRRVLKPRGKYIVAGAVGAPDGGLLGPFAPFLKVAVLQPFMGKKFQVFGAKLDKRDLDQIGELIDQGRIRPVIDRSYSLSDVSEAIRYLLQGHARGKVLISIEQT